MRSRGVVVGAGAPPGSAAAVAPAVPLGAGTPPEDATGTLAAPVAPGAVAVTGGLADGKKVACLPLWTCHWSHSSTIEKPKITHRIVRRMSFMDFSYVGK